MKRKLLVILVIVMIASIAFTAWLFNRPSEMDNAALFTAIAEGDSEAVSTMIDDGQSVNVTNDAGLTAFQTAVISLQPGIGTLLLEEGADPQEGDGWLIVRSMIDPAIDRAELNGQLFVLLQELHEHDSDLIFEQNGEDESLLFEAVRMRHEDLFVWLIDQGVETDTINSSGDTVFHTAARFPFESVSFVTDHVTYSGGKVNGNSDMPITVAVKSNNPEWIKEFAKTDEINWQNEKGWTALMFAADYGFTESVAVLLELGADTGIENDNGETAVDIADEYGQTEISNLLNQ